MSRQFDGVGDNIDIGSPAILGNLAALTFAAWIYPTSLAGDEFGFLSKGSTSGALIHLIVGDDFGLSDILLMRVAHATTGAIARSVNNTVIVNTWQFVAGTWTTGQSPKLYYGTTPGGVAEVAYQTQQSPVGAQGDDSAKRFILGARSNDVGTGVNIPFAGNIQYPLVYNAVMTLAQLKEIAIFKGAYKANLIGDWPMRGASPEVDYSGQGNNGTVTGAVTSTLEPNVTSMDTFCPAPITPVFSPTRISV